MDHNRDIEKVLKRKNIRGDEKDKVDRKIYKKNDTKRLGDENEYALDSVYSNQKTYSLGIMDGHLVRMKMKKKTSIPNFWSEIGLE